MAALSKPKPQPAPPPARPADREAMVDPAHPMHQELLRRMSAEPAGAPRVEDARWSRPARLAFAFYAGLAAWGMVAATVFLLSRLA